jgi:hypothetical protein
MTVTADLRAGWSLPGDSAAVAFSNHAVERFAERLRPGMDPDEVRRQLSGMLASAVVTTKPPEWFKPRQRADAYLVVADVVMPLRRCAHDELIAVSAIEETTLTDASREKRSTYNRKQRSGKQAARHAKKHHDRGRPAADPQAEEWNS